MLTDVTTTERWIFRPAPRDEARMRLFCLPFAGGGATAYRPWIEHLPADIELCLVRLPGRETRMREAPYTDLKELVSDLADVVEPLLDRSYALFGHSMGALAAYALACRVGSVGLRQPEHLFVSGRRPPQIPDDEAPLHQLPDAAFVAALVRRYNGIPKQLLQNVDLLRLFLPILRADLTMLETFEHTESAPLDCPITAMGGWEDGRATQVQLASWRDLTRGDFAMRMFPGGHFYIQAEQAPLLELITRTLGRAGTNGLEQPLTVGSYVDFLNPRISG